MKLNSAVSKFLTNRIVLNIVAILALFNVIGYAVMGNLNNVIFFILIAVLVRYFSKNMTIVLGVPLILVNLIKVKGNILEGMENNESSDKPKPAPTNDKPVPSNEKPAPTTNDKKAPTNSKTDSESQQLMISSVANSNDSSSSEQQGFEPGRRKNRGYNIDYATTIEDAYDELNNILGSDGIQRLTSDTQNLMKQQMQLAEAMKGMGPIIKNMEPMINNLKGMMGQMGDGKEGLGGLMDLAKKISGQQPQAN